MKSALSLTKLQSCWLSLLLFLVVVGLLTGCAGNAVEQDQQARTVIRYFGVDPGVGANGVTINHSTAFITEQEDSSGSIPQQQNAGSFSLTSRGFLQVTLTQAFGLIQNPPVAGTWGFEIFGEAALLRLSKNGLSNNAQTAMTLLAPTERCPDSSQGGSFQFVTIPIVQNGGSWNAATDTAFGSTDISIDGTAVNLSNVRQFTRTGGPPQNPGAATAVGGCGPAVYGNTISVPADGTAPPPAPSAATLAIGPTGFLLESNGITPRSNLLGAGSGAVGVKRPLSPLNTSDVTGAQYGGFITYSATPLMTLSPVASFGWQGAPTNLPTGCQPRTSTTLVGGDFILTGNNDNPMAAMFPNGLGNFNYCIDLGAQDSNNNGLYSSAVVTHFLPPSTTLTYDAVAVVGKLQNRYVIFLVGKGRGASGAAAAPLGIYLFQDSP